MPVLTLVCHLTLIYSNGFPAGVTIFSKHGIEAVEAEGPPVPHDVPLTSQLPVALETCEMLHVPSSTFSFGALVSQDDLVTSSAAWLQALGVMSAAVEMCILPEIYEIDEELPTDVAVEASRVPASVGSSPGCHHNYVSTTNALSTIRACHGGV